MSRRRRLTASGRVALAVTAVLAVGVLALSAVAYVSVSRRLAADVDRSLVGEAEAYAAAVGPAPLGKRSPDLVTVSRAYLAARTSAETASHAVLLVRFPDKRVLSNSDFRLENAAGNAALLATATATRRFATLATSDGDYRVAVVPVTDRTGRVAAVFEAALPLAPTRQVATQLGSTLLAAGLAVVLLGAALSAVVARGSLRPLRRVATAAAGVTQASLGRRIGYDGPDDEVGRMVEAFNGMMERLQESFGEQKRFVADASHELRTPMAVVRGHLELLQRPDLAEEERTEAFAIASEELARMDRLVDDLLALARLDSGAPRPRQPLDLGTLAEEVVARFRTLGATGVSLRCAAAPWVEGDPDGLLQAFINLVGNALSHAPGGEVVVECRTEGADAVVDVADTGPGIREEDLPRIFDRFYRAHGPRPAGGGGSGLGLAITKRIVELHGGSVSAANRPDGLGAVFTVRLPRIEPPADAGGSDPAG